MKIISKYVLREHVGPLTFALTALTSLMLLNFISRQFGELVGKGLPWTVIGEFFLLSIPFTVALTVPMSNVANHSASSRSSIGFNPTSTGPAALTRMLSDGHRLASSENA